MAINPILLASLLLTDEPQFAELARLGAKLKSALVTLFKSDDSTLVARAATLAGTLRDTTLATQLIEKVVEHRDPNVRIAAVAATEFLPGKDAAKILVGRLSDENEDVREMAAKMITSAMPKSLRSRLDKIADDESESPELRELCRTLSATPPEPPVEREPIGPNVSSLEELELEVDPAEVAKEGEDEIDDAFDGMKESDAIIGELLLLPAKHDDHEDQDATNLD